MRPKHHPISLRLKIQPKLVDRLDQIRTTHGLSMNEAVNLTLATALEAKGSTNDRNNPKD
jgi:antitoxin component of RelBE/YafQ-DinJ toxin-antitoxin module